MTLWVLALFYWVHLLATVIWLGGMALLALIALPAWRQQTLATNQWLALQQRFTPWVNASMVLLWITGFVQMTNDEHYTGFLSVDSTWAWAMLIKHISVLALMGLGFYAQFRILPAMTRIQLLAGKKPALAATEEARLSRQEQQLLRLNLLCAALVLLLTAVATAA
jgi:uncharacterized membrane protein